MPADVIGVRVGGDEIPGRSLGADERSPVPGFGRDEGRIHQNHAVVGDDASDIGQFIIGLGEYAGRHFLKGHLCFLSCRRFRMTETAGAIRR